MSLGPDPVGCGIHPLAFFAGCLVGGAGLVCLFKGLTALCLMAETWI